MGNKAVTTHLEYKDEKSSKFWEISVNGNGLTVRYGKIGTEGQVQTKAFADAATAEKQAQKLIAEKTGKGYQEGAGGKESLSNPAPTLDVQTKTEKPAKAAKNKPLTPGDIAKNPESTAEALASLVGSSETIDRLLAKHPKAGAALLEKLSHSSDKATRKSVCLNPNTPKETLIRLAPQFPGDFFQNPAFDWLLIEDPNLLFDIGGGVLKNILKRPECPTSFLKWAVGHGNEQEQLAAAMNPQTPVESLRELLKSEFASVVAAAKGHAALAGEQTKPEMGPEAEFLAGIAEALANLSEEEAVDLLVRGYLGMHHIPALASEMAFNIMRGNALMNSMLSDTQSVSLLEAFSKDENESIRYRVASNPNCPVSLRDSLLKTLAKSKDQHVLKKVAANPNCPESVLKTLANSKDPEVRSSVASNPNCPLLLMELLASDQHDYVRREVAANPNCPVPLMEQLLQTPFLCAPSGVASNPNCPVPMLEALAVNGDSEVRCNVAYNPNCPLSLRRSLLEALAQDDGLYHRRPGWGCVREKVASNPSCPESLLEVLAKDKKVETRCAVASNPNCPMSLLESLSKDRNAEVRSAVAFHPHCPESLLEVLAKDKNADVRRVVASNSNSPESTIKALSNDCDMIVRANTLVWNEAVRAVALARNVQFVSSLATPKGRMEWIERERRLRQDEAGLTLLSSPPTLEKKGENHNNALVRALAFCRTDVAVETLAKNQKHVSWLVRAAIARNRNCPETVLKALEKDSHQVVAALAKRGLSQVSAFKNSANASKGKS